MIGINSANNYPKEEIASDLFLLLAVHLFLLLKVCRCGLSMSIDQYGKLVNFTIVLTKNNGVGP